GGRPRNDSPLTDEHSVPPLAHAFERDRLDRAVQRTVQLDLEGAHALDVEPVALEFASIAVDGKGDAVEAQIALETRKSGGLAGLDPAKEVLVGPLCSPANRLQHAEVDGGHVGTVT